MRIIIGAQSPLEIMKVELRMLYKNLNKNRDCSRQKVARIMAKTK